MENAGVVVYAEEVVICPRFLDEYEREEEGEVVEEELGSDDDDGEDDGSG